MYKNLLTAFLVLLPLSLSATDRQIGKFRQNRIYYCDAETNSVTIRQFSESGDIISEKIVKRRKVRSRIERFRQQLIALRELKDSLGIRTRKRQRTKAQIETINTLRRNLRKCIFGNQQSDQDFAPVPIDPDSLPNGQIDFNHTAGLSGPISGECELYGRNVGEIPTGVTSPLLAPLSGSLRCSLPTNPNRNLLLRVFANNSDTNPELLLSEVVDQTDINQENVFYVTLCKNRPGCYRSKKVIAALQTTGVTVKLDVR